MTRIGMSRSWNVSPEKRCIAASILVPSLVQVARYAAAAGSKAGSLLELRARDGGR
jgi:hypothetical protein